MRNKLISDVEISIKSSLIFRCFDTIPAQLSAPFLSPHCASATANTSSPTLTRPGTRSEVISPPSSLNSLQLANDIDVVPVNGSKAAPACSACAAPSVPKHIITASRSSTAEVNTRRDMLGLCGSLSLPSLLLPLDPVPRRRLCVRGAITAATRESIEICVCGRCVCCCWSFQCLRISQWRLAFSRNFLPSVCVREAEREEKTSQAKR
ncbi:hypothetical protein ECC02_005559 [Trypanosoma cruzi]|uniref:Uncharacterized protein n=1 Tax=Trypanosoma cruzi TaxID=5693 RepID=A0A7J6Y3Q9_TRYCR|nr:hypothetical protein ECC02_005559 [Trypanosoma cruzi]